MGTPFRTLIALGLLGIVVCTLVAHQPLNGADPQSKAKPPDTVAPAMPAPIAKDKSVLSSAECAWQELAKPTKCELIETPLKEIMEFLSEQHALTIVFDEAALKEAGLSSDAPAPNIILKGLSLDSALRVILRPTKLTHIVTDDGLILITTAEAAGRMLTTRVYPVQDLIAAKDELGEDFLDYNALIDPIIAIVHGGCCDEPDPKIAEALCGLNGTLVVRQSQENQLQIAGLLAALREAKRRQEKILGGVPVFVCRKSFAEPDYVRIREALEKPQSCEFIEELLRNIIEDMAKKTGVNFQFDEAALKEAGLSSETEVANIHLQRLPARVELQTLLASMKLTYVIRDEVVLITTIEAANTMLETRVYPVGDLLQTAEPFSEDRTGATIPNSVFPQSWSTRRGPGSIELNWQSKSLIVTQSAAVHEQLEKFLEQLRTEHREHSPATPLVSPKAVTFEDRVITKVFSLKPSTNKNYLAAADVAAIVKNATGAKAWLAEGTIVVPSERVEVKGGSGQPDNKIIHPSLVIRNKPAVLRDARRLLKELNVWPEPVEKVAVESGTGPAFNIKPPAAGSVLVPKVGQQNLTDTMPAAAKCEGHDEVCPVPAKKPAGP